MHPQSQTCTKALIPGFMPTPEVLWQEVGVHVLAGVATLSKDPLPHAVAIVPLRDAVKAAGARPQLPEGCQRMVVTIDGTESDEELASVQAGPAPWSS